MKDETLKRVNDVFSIEKECIDGLEKSFDIVSFEKAVSLLVGAERIATCGCGHSGIMCQHFAHLLCCVEQPARFISPAEAVHGAMGFLKENDVMVFASRGGKTKELFPILDICKKKGIKVITITENLESELALGSDVVLKQYVNRETDRFNSQGTTSSVSLCVVFHTLVTAVMEETGFVNEQFAVIHPGGAVGERLNNN